jgi:cellulose synthase/poly-beta-1,6-N-acetylglucosamine synthase-like glycosyltransferase
MLAESQPMNFLSISLLCSICASVAYLYLLAIASLRSPRTATSEHPIHSFAIVIPAHNEEGVIASTVRRLFALKYPRQLFQVFVVADHCTDKTAKEAGAAGAVCLERSDARTGTGAALAWLFKRVFEEEVGYDAVVVFDADTRVDMSFLRVMDARLQSGDNVVQGCHRILNPQDGWFAALTWAMFIVDNRFQNLGRANLGWSAKNMGDSICFRADILRRLGWGEGLTEDYDFRQRLLLNGIKIGYEPTAIGCGEAPVSWSAARTQRMRWLSGTVRASRRHAWTMLCRGLQNRDSAVLDGALQAFLPSYSTLTLLGVGVLVSHLLFSEWFARELTYAWGALIVALGAYPFVGLVLERAPLQAYTAILIGPIFVLWRTALAIRARLGGSVEWVRTERRGNLQTGVGK